jgi:hypothetical protein
MSRDKILGAAICAISLLAALAAGIFFVLSGESFSLAVFVAPALGFLVGLSIFFFSFVQENLQVTDEIKEFPKLVEDDLQKIRSGAFTFTHIVVALTLLAVLVEVGLLFWYRKERASWGPLNVLVVAVVVAAAALFLSMRAGWFQQRKHRLSPYTFAIPAIGWGICILIGISFAEPREFGGQSPMEESRTVTAVSGAASTRSGDRMFFNSLEYGGDALSGFDCDDEGCLVILLVAVVVIAVIASAFIPHFWVVATTLLLTLMAVVALREVLYHDDFA